MTYTEKDWKEGNKAEWKRPWQAVVPALTDGVTQQQGPSEESHVAKAG